MGFATELPELVDELASWASEGRQDDNQILLPIFGSEVAA